MLHVYVLPQLHILELGLSVGKVCQVHKLIYASVWDMSVHCVTVTALVHAHGVCALESSSYNIRQVLRKGPFHTLP